ncbi:MAG: cyclic pyranopterin monophosphate synthase MoaC [Candidatus Methanomethylicaceae archaeon]|jgi:cyclic pyranopterin phosphate synthase
MSVKMIDISSKDPVSREASATGTIQLKESTVERIKSNGVEKGDVLAVARVAAVQAVKRTPDTIPLCHQIPIEHVSVDFEISASLLRATVKVKACAKTGVEMEALAGVSAALLTVWDMTKKYEKDEAGQYPSTAIGEIRVLEKRKGARGRT